MSKWDLINPSDAVEFETSDFGMAVLVTVLLGNGQYGAREIEGDREVPIMLFGVDAEFVAKATGHATLDEFLTDVRQNRGEELAAVFDTVGYPGANGRTSLNNIVGRARKIAEVLRGERVEIPAAPKQVFTS